VVKPATPVCLKLGNSHHGPLGRRDRQLARGFGDGDYVDGRLYVSRKLRGGIIRVDSLEKVIEKLATRRRPRSPLPARKAAKSV
jgi:hypothetical protein